MKKESEKLKAFNNWRHNGIHLTFPNGNSISTVWGIGSYTDNHFLIEKDPDTAFGYRKFLDSDTCEIMILKAPDKLIKKIHKKYGDGDNSVIGYLTIKQWLEIINLISK
jgi:hypothetical protein